MLLIVHLYWKFPIVAVLTGVTSAVTDDQGEYPPSSNNAEHVTLECGSIHLPVDYNVTPHNLYRVYINL